MESRIFGQRICFGGRADARLSAVVAAGLGRSGLPLILAAARHG